MKKSVVCPNRLHVYRFPHLLEHPEINHGIFARTMGFSRPPFQCLNVGLSVGDDPEHVRQNRQAISACLDDAQLVFLHQVHGTEVIRLRQAEAGLLDQPQGVRTGDAIVTDIPGLSLVVQVADCQPLLLYDPSAKVVAAVHSGWRGSVKNIIAVTVQAMADSFGCRPAHILAGIGPSLGPCCAEFIHYRSELPESFRKYKIGDYHFDFWRISRDQLLDSGVLEDNILVSEICTRCHVDQFYSYRREKQTGRFAAAIGLRERHQEGP